MADPTSDSVNLRPLPPRDIQKLDERALRRKYPKEWRAYISARSRCNNPKNPRYKANKQNKVSFTFLSFTEFLQSVGRCPRSTSKKKPYRLCRTSIWHNFGVGDTFWCRWRTDNVERKPTDPIPDFGNKGKRGRV